MLKSPREEAVLLSISSRVANPKDTQSDKGSRLIVLVGVDAGRIYTVGKEATIGRSSEVDVRLMASHISRRHARIYLNADNEYVIEDLKSCNGTFVNGISISSKTIRFGDKISLGSDTMLLFTYYEPLENQAVLIQKMQAMGHLAAGIAHDFNNLLNVITASFEYLSGLSHTGKFTRPDISDSLKDGLAASRRATELTRRLLNFANPGKPCETSINISKLLDDVTSMMRRTFNNSIQILLEAEPLLTVKGDQTQLIQVMMNLCINASNAMPEGGKLTISAKKVDHKDLTNIPIQSSTSHVVISIEDNGKGMDQSTCNHIFDPFFNLKVTNETGRLGLSTVYNIVKSHGGHILVDSEVGSGSCFKVYLPIMQEELEKNSILDFDDTTAVVGESLCQETTHILLVDDEELVLRSTTRLLSKIGYKIYTASNGNHAVSLYEKYHQNIQVILLDLNMPGGNGEDTFYQLLKIDDTAKIILFSGYWDEERIQRILNNGAFAFIRKPVDAKTLKKALSQAISV